MKTFPEDTQKHAMIYRDPQIQTLNEGLRILHRISNPMLCYTQHIRLRAPTMDRSYENHVRHNERDGIFYLSFPSQCTYMTHFRTNHPCKMVTYLRDRDNGLVKEILITKTADIRNYPDTEILVYTQHQTELILSYDVYLMKSANLPSKL